MAVFDIRVYINSIIRIEKMSQIEFFNPYITRKRKSHLFITITTQKDFKSLYKKLSKAAQTECDERGFKGKGGQALIIRGKDGEAEKLIMGCNKDFTYQSGSKLYNAVKRSFCAETLKSTSFEIEKSTLKDAAFERLHIGWGWAAYSFETYKQDKQKKRPALIISKDANKKNILAQIESVCLIRDLVNTPANDMGPDELEAAAKYVAEHHDLKLKVIKDKALLNKNFPMIFDVGRASTRRPRLLDFTWGNSKHPKVTLVGKGVCFDTGGLDLKPSAFMYDMKKDMGGSAHVLALAHMIMTMKLPVRLRVLIPAVENSVAGNAYRPADVLQTRKGITVEVGNTDAEGRLVLADALTHACEEKPELIIDFATLTGAARVAVGFGLPALFSNNGDTAYKIQKLSAKTEVNDAVWNLPLWKPYRKELDSPIADIKSTGGKAGATAAALFLNEFIEEDIEWIHMDVFSWEKEGSAGRPVGGADTGMRAIYAYLEDRYGK